MAFKKLLGVSFVAVASLALSACSNCCGCGPYPAVYKKPCCAQSQSKCGCAAPAAAAPAAMPAPAAKPAGQMACGTGKCG